APFFLLVAACVEAVNDGWNPRPAQFAAWKRLDTGALAPCALVSVPVTANGSQLVGLNMNPERSTVTFTVRMSNGTPCRIVGSGSLTIVICPVLRSTLTDARTTTF